jgi:hypothetical protein
LKQVPVKIPSLDGRVITPSQTSPVKGEEYKELQKLLRERAIRKSSKNIIFSKDMS